MVPRLRKQAPAKRSGEVQGLRKGPVRAKGPVRRHDGLATPVNRHATPELPASPGPSPDGFADTTKFPVSLTGFSHAEFRRLLTLSLNETRSREKKTAALGRNREFFILGT